MAMLSVDQVAVEFGTQPDVILDWVTSGALPAPTMIDGTPRWSEKALLDWECACSPRLKPPTPQEMARIRLGVLRENYRDIFAAAAALEKESSQ